MEVGGGWRKSSYSMSNGDCVEVAPDGGRVLVRDSKAPGPVLAVSGEAWQVFISGIKANGRLDKTMAAV